MQMFFQLEKSRRESGEMKNRCGIITIFKKSDEPNYGNIFQLYALNSYLNSISPAIDFETIYLLDEEPRKYVGNIIGRAKLWLMLKIVGFRNRNLKSQSKFDAIIEERKESFRGFLLNNGAKIVDMSSNDLIKNTREFKAFIVGSDVVWGQSEFGINRIRFLLFGKKQIKRFSYAASFGNNNIPQANISAVVEAIKQFDMVSVRESETVEMLRKLGISNVEHVLDPTFLIEKEKWKSLCKKPNAVNDADRFLFLYVLGDSELIYNKVKLLANKMGVKVIQIAYANGYFKSQDIDNDCVLLEECSPENFLWLINFSELVVTDSFHGMALSTNLEKSFIALQREGKSNINSRILDFLSISNQMDKLISPTEIEKFDYSKEFAKDELVVHEYIEKSKQYLDEVIKVVN